MSITSTYIGPFGALGCIIAVPEHKWLHKLPMLHLIRRCSECYAGKPEAEYVYMDCLDCMRGCYAGVHLHQLYTPYNLGWAPPTNSGILGIYKDPNKKLPLPLVVTTSGWGLNLKCNALKASQIHQQVAFGQILELC